MRAFGSRVTGKAKRYSDLDLAVIADSSLPQHIFSELREAFDESELPFRVDVLDWANISPAFQSIIDRQYVALNYQDTQTTTKSGF